MTTGPRAQGAADSECRVPRSDVPVISVRLGAESLPPGLERERDWTERESDWTFGARKWVLGVMLQVAPLLVSESTRVFALIEVIY